MLSYQDKTAGNHMNTRVPGEWCARNPHKCSSLLIRRRPKKVCSADHIPRRLIYYRDGRWSVVESSRGCPPIEWGICVVCPVVVLFANRSIDLRFIDVVPREWNRQVYKKKSVQSEQD